MIAKLEACTWSTMLAQITKSKAKNDQKSKLGYALSARCCTVKLHSTTSTRSVVEITRGLFLMVSTIEGFHCTSFCQSF